MHFSESLLATMCSYYCIRCQLNYSIANSVSTILTFTVVIRFSHEFFVYIYRCVCCYDTVICKIILELFKL